MPGLFKILPLLFTAAFTCACAGPVRRMDWIPTGPAFAPKTTEAVSVYTSRREVKHPFGAIGLLHGWNVSPSDRDALDRQVRLARELSAANGADALVATEGQPGAAQATFASDPNEKTQTYIYGIAIKYTDALTAEEKQVVRDWEKANSGGIVP